MTWSARILFAMFQGGGILPVASAWWRVAIKFGLWRGPACARLGCR
jgi:hypothetical protein